MKRFAEPAVAAVFAAYPAALRKCLLALRELVFDVAARTDGVGALTEKSGLVPTFLAHHLRK
jgi:hypothetical protein